MCCEIGLHLLPVAIILLVPTTFIVCYVIAVCLQHVSPGFPYISDTGTRSPESCVFAQLLNICAVLIGITMYVRYKQIAEYNQDESVLIKRHNQVSFGLGIVAALGMSIVGNFQVTNVVYVHLVGAVMAFGLGTVYCWIQTRLSYLMRCHTNSTLTCHLRAFFSFMATLLFISTLLFGLFCVYLDWGFAAHVASSASEWAMALFLMLFFATFIGEFRKISMSSPEIRIIVRRVPPDPQRVITDPVV